MKREGPFIIIGMGRSGTSYVANILARAGIDMGNELKPADEHNERGYFEDLEALQMHQGWLNELGLSFGSIDERFPLDPGPERPAQIAAFVDRRRREQLGSNCGHSCTGSRSPRPARADSRRSSSISTTASGWRRDLRLCRGHTSTRTSSDSTITGAGRFPTSRRCGGCTRRC